MTRKARRKVLEELTFLMSQGLAVQCYDPERDEEMIVVKYLGNVYTDGFGHFYDVKGNICVRRRDLEEVFKQMTEKFSKWTGKTARKKISLHGTEMERWI